MFYFDSYKKNDRLTILTDLVHTIVQSASEQKISKINFARNS